MAFAAKLLRLGRIRFHQLKPVEEHRHDFFHFFYVLKGKGFVVLNGSLYELSPGEIHIYHPHWTHDVWAQPHANFETLDLRFLVENQASMDLALELPPFLCTGPLAQRLRNVIREIELLGIRQDNPLWHEAADAHLTILLSMLFDSDATQRSEFNDDHSSVPAAALKHMVESLPGGISVAEVADRVYMSPTHLTTLFKSRFGKTAQELMIQLRIEYAMQLLATSPRPKVTQVAHEVGWSDVRDFRGHFRKMTGMTPRDFAQRYSDFTGSQRTSESWLVFDDNMRMTWTNVVPSRPPKQ